MPAKARPEPPDSSQRWIWKSGVLLLLVVLFLGGLIWAGRSGLETLRGKERYEIAFLDIECEPPAAMTRADFLNEVRYEARLPERINLVDETLDPTLRAAFALHPWVEKVEGVDVQPPKRLVVRLVQRVPVMCVKVGATLRAVDATGVLLPKNAPTLGLGVYEGDAKIPAGVGLLWGDPNVEAAAHKLRK